MFYVCQCCRTNGTERLLWVYWGACMAECRVLSWDQRLYAEQSMYGSYIMYNKRRILLGVVSELDITYVNSCGHFNAACMRAKSDSLLNQGAVNSHVSKVLPSYPSPPRPLASLLQAWDIPYVLR